MANTTANRGHRTKVKTLKGGRRALRAEGGIDEKQRRLVDAYWRTLSPVKACVECDIETDFPDKTIYRLLQQPGPMSYLQEKMQTARAQGLVDDAKLIADLEYMRNLSPWDFLVEQGTGDARTLRLRPQSEIPREAARWIKKIKIKSVSREVDNGEDKAPTTVTEVTTDIEFHSVLDVIDKLARMIGAYRDRYDAEGGKGVLHVVALPKVAMSVDEWESQLRLVESQVRPSEKLSGPPSRARKA